MAKPVAVEPLGNWHKLFGDFEASPIDFYASVEKAIERRKIPDTQVSRVEWRESGLTSAKREYLRVRRGQHVFDVCAAPFGTGFFFSWWFAQARPGAFKPTLAVVLVAAFVAYVALFLDAEYLSKMIGVPLVGTVGIFLVTSLVLFGAIGAYLAQGESELAAQMLAVPILGRVWELVFIPATYFRTDSQTMFRSAVHAAVMEAVDALTEAKGLKALTEDERKPIMKEFFRK